MGDRYVLEVTCPECGCTDDDVWYASTCDVTWWICPKCGNKIDLSEHTGISREEASNADTIADIASFIGAKAVELRESTLWPIAVVDEIQNVMMEGERVGKCGKGWAESVEHHIEKAIEHLKQYGHDNTEDHLAHAFTRLMMACAIERGYVDGRTKEIDSDKSQ